MEKSVSRTDDDQRLRLPVGDERAVNDASDPDGTYDP